MVVVIIVAVVGDSVVVVVIVVVIVVVFVVVDITMFTTPLFTLLQEVRPLGHSPRAHACQRQHSGKYLWVGDTKDTTLTPYLVLPKLVIPKLLISNNWPLNSFYS